MPTDTHFVSLVHVGTAWNQVPHHLYAAMECSPGQRRPTTDTHIGSLVHVGTAWTQVPHHLYVAIVCGPGQRRLTNLQVSTNARERQPFETFELITEVCNHPTSATHAPRGQYMPTPTTANADGHSLRQPCSQRHRLKPGAAPPLCGHSVRPRAEASDHPAGKHKHTGASTLWDIRTYHRGVQPSYVHNG